MASEQDNGSGESADLYVALGQLQRAIGRIEGAQAAMLAKLDSMAVFHVNHERDDRRNFSDVRNLIEKRVKEQNEAREKQFDELCTKVSTDIDDVKKGMQEMKSDISSIQAESNRAKGAGWVIIGIITALTAFLGSAVIALWSGHIKIH